MHYDFALFNLPQYSECLDNGKEKPEASCRAASRLELCLPQRSLCDETDHFLQSDCAGISEGLQEDSGQLLPLP